MSHIIHLLCSCSLTFIPSILPHPPPLPVANGVNSSKQHSLIVPSDVHLRLSLRRPLSFSGRRPLRVVPLVFSRSRSILLGRPGLSLSIQTRRQSYGSRRRVRTTAVIRVSRVPSLRSSRTTLLNLTRFFAYRTVTPESPIAINPAVFQLPGAKQEKKSSSAMSLFSNFSSDNSSSESSPMVDLIPKTTTTVAIATKVEPPPPVQPRKVDTTGSHRVIFPAKESCYKSVLFVYFPFSVTILNTLICMRCAFHLMRYHTITQFGHFNAQHPPNGNQIKSRNASQSRIRPSICEWFLRRSLKL